MQCNLENFDAEFHHFARFVVTYKESLMTDPTFTSVLDINKNILQNEVLKVTHKAKCGKAVGLDSIPYDLLNHKNLQQLIQYFFQLCFDTGQIPTLWTKAIIVPLPKGGNKTPHVPLNYRGISLLCNAGKLYSSLLNIRGDRIETLFRKPQLAVTEA